MTLDPATLTILGHADPSLACTREPPPMYMATGTKYWTFEEVDELPEDGSKQEVIDGELCVTPPPDYRHEHVSARLCAILTPFVESQGLGMVFGSHSVFQVGRLIRVQPDLSIRTPHPGNQPAWETAPVPRLVIEVISPSSRLRDLGKKREVYLGAGIPEYWTVDHESRVITVFRQGAPPLVVREQMEWMPAGATLPLRFALDQLFI